MVDNTNQGELIAALQNLVDKGDRTYEELWHRYWDELSVDGLHFNERMLNYINDVTGETYTDINVAMMSYVDLQSKYNWSSAGPVPVWGPWALNDQGAAAGWYDPSDLSSMSTDIMDYDIGAVQNNFTNPGIGDAVGTIVDKSRLGGHTFEGYLRQTPNSIENGWNSFTVTTSGGSVTISDGGSTIYVDAREAAVVLQASNVYDNTNAASWGEIELIETDGVISSDILVSFSRSNNVRIGNQAAGKFERLEIANTSPNFSVVVASGHTATLKNPVAKDVPGNHIVADSDDARPVLRDEPYDPDEASVAGQPELFDPDYTEGQFSKPSYEYTDTVDGRTVYVWERDGGGFGNVNVAENHPPEKWYRLEYEFCDYPSGQANTTSWDIRGIVSYDYKGINGAERLTATAVDGQVYAHWFQNRDAFNRYISFTQPTSGFSGALYKDSISIKELRDDAPRVYSLEFDGTDDAMECGFDAGTLDATDNTIVTGIEMDGGQSQFVLHTCVNEAGDYAWLAIDTDTNTNLFSNLTVTSASVLRANGANITWTDRDALEADIDTGKHELLATFDMDNWDGFGIGNYPTFEIDGRWYGTFFIGRALTATEIGLIENYYANKTSRSKQE